MIKKIKLFKKVLELSKEVKKILQENKNEVYELRQWFETGKILFPSLRRLLNEIFELVKSDNN